jgi:hypothetical protein
VFLTEGDDRELAFAEGVPDDAVVEAEVEPVVDDNVVVAFRKCLAMTWHGVGTVVWPPQHGKATGKLQGGQLPVV